MNFVYKTWFVVILKIKYKEEKTFSVKEKKKLRKSRDIFENAENFNVFSIAIKGMLS